MIKNVFIDRRTLFAGESIKIKNYSGRILKVKLYVITISDLFQKRKEKGFPEYKVIFSSTIEEDLREGEFEVRYPETFPPTISTKHFKTRCSLLIGYPRFGGRILFPRTEIRLKILPIYNMIEGGDKNGVLIRKSYYEPEEEIVCKVLTKIEDVTGGVLIREWYREEEEMYDEYVLCEEEAVRGDEIVIKLPHDFSRVEDPFLFYPYSFYSKTQKSEFGIKAYVFIQNKSTLIKKEIAISPRKPQFRRVV